VTAALIDEIMCRHCGTSLVADVTGHAWEAGPCRVASPAEAAGRAGDVARRHRDSVRLAAARRAQPVRGDR